MHNSGKLKGLSQILYLIIAAAVLMMVAMSLLFGFTGSSDTRSIDRQACAQSMRATCQTAPSGNDIPIPGVCNTTDNSGNTVQLINNADAVGSPVDSVDDGTFQCE